MTERVDRLKPHVPRENSRDGQVMTGATGQTILRLRQSPIARMVDQAHIGPEELQAAHDIALAFQSMAGALFIRPLSMERLDRSHGGGLDSGRVIDAQRRYRSWADHWSARKKKFSDRTLEIVISAVVDELPISVMEANFRMRHGRVKTAICEGLRDYAQRAGWIGGRHASGHCNIS